ncbi:hypothetical protein GGD71_004747 [Variovorax guangxiensis]|uniref:Uncharacterized protein n=1 Tax=Variovorax guangxiensis TaxID=1775474 RepID=A0A840FN30_9BURK|nr:hypothetical protein [Variovorax guangxiensis]
MTETAHYIETYKSLITLSVAVSSSVHWQTVVQ